MKPLGNINWLAVILVTVLASGIILGSHWLYNRSALTGPLKTQLGEVSGVREVDLELERGTWVIRINVERVNSWEKLHGQLHGVIQVLLGTRPYTLQIEDSRTPLLEEALAEASFSLEEAVSTGRYTLLSETREALKEGPEIQVARVSVVPGWVLVQLEEPRGYLYHSLPRPGSGWEKVSRE